MISHLFDLCSDVSAMLLRPRALNLLLAAWLSVSAFVFPHLPAQRLVSLLAGIVALTLTLLARRSIVTHRAVLLVGFGILLSLFVYWPLPMTAWNNLAVALAMVCFATMNPEHFTSRRRHLRL